MSTTAETMPVWEVMDIDKKIDTEVWDVARAMARAIRNGFNRLDARPPYDDFKARTLAEFDRMRATGIHADL